MIDSVYIHIPFCKYICSYCDFCKKYIKNQDVDGYLIALEKEIKNQENILCKTIYIGGGTPSSLNISQLNKLCQIIKENFKFKDGYEFSFECNPDDVSDAKLSILKDMGVNRLCIGMQTVNDDILVKIKRGHTKNDSQLALDIAHKYFDNVSVDFIFNLPEQSKDDIIESLEFIQKNNHIITNVSYYGLILESNTLLDITGYELGDEADEADMYNLIQKELTNLGYIQYEISNFAKPNFSSIHNDVYWQANEYYGFGLSASGYVDGYRMTNTYSLKDYINGSNTLLSNEQVSDEEKLYEKIFLSLRTTRGIKKEFLVDNNLKYDINDFNEVDGNISIKPEKLYISSEIIVNILEQL